MKTKHERPSWVLNFKKPTGTEIKHINGHWYLYERSSVWDASKGKPKKKSGKLIGTITENGLILKKEKQNIDAISCFEFGASSFLLDNTHELKERLETYYPTFWKTIYSLVLMKVKENCALSEFKIVYDSSYLKIKLGTQKFDFESALVYLAEQIEIIESFFNIEECNLLFNYYEKLTNKDFNVDLHLLDYTTYNNLEDDILFIQSTSKSKPRKETLSYGLAIINYMALHLINSLNNIIAEKGLYNKYRLENIMSSLKTVKLLKINRSLNITKPFKSVEKLCLDLDVKLSLKN